MFYYLILLKPPDSAGRFISHRVFRLTERSDCAIICRCSDLLTSLSRTPPSNCGRIQLNESFRRIFSIRRMNFPKRLSMDFPGGDFDLKTNTPYEGTVQMAVANYRSMFFLYAMHAMNVQHQPEKASRILDRMEEVIPRRSVGMNYKIKYDLASFYYCSSKPRTNR